MTSTEADIVAAQPPEVPALEVKNLHVNFAGRQPMFDSLRGKTAPSAKAVDGVDFSLGKGEIVALAGESGCGKTTLARAIMGILTPESGEVLHEGLSIRSGNIREYRRRVQMVFQDPTGSLNPRKTIYELVAEGLRVHKVPGNEEEHVASALSRAGLRPPDSFYLLYPHEMSGGQRQRVVIAGALALHPEVIVADEPVSSLDASVRGEILKLLMDLRADLQISILVITHDLGLAWTIADRVVVMYLGRVVESGPTEDVLLRPIHPYTKALLDVVPEAGGTERPILRGEPPDPTRIPPGCRFHLRCPVVASGRAAELGIEERCKGEDLALRELRPGHWAACHAADMEPSQS